MAAKLFRVLTTGDVVDSANRVDDMCVEISQNLAILGGQNKELKAANHAFTIANLAQQQKLELVYDFIVKTREEFKTLIHNHGADLLPYTTLVVANLKVGLDDLERRLSDG